MIPVLRILRLHRDAFLQKPDKAGNVTQLVEYLLADLKSCCQFLRLCKPDKRVGINLPSVAVIKIMTRESHFGEETVYYSLQL